MKSSKSAAPFGTVGSMSVPFGRWWLLSAVAMAIELLPAVPSFSRQGVQKLARQAVRAEPLGKHCAEHLVFFTTSQAADDQREPSAEIVHGRAIEKGRSVAALERWGLVRLSLHRRFCRHGRSAPPPIALKAGRPPRSHRVGDIRRRIAGNRRRKRSDLRRSRVFRIRLAIADDTGRRAGACGEQDCGCDERCFERGRAHAIGVNSHSMIPS